MGGVGVGVGGCYEMDQEAYIKLVLHSLKHSTSSVNGILLGRRRTTNNDAVEISDAVPLFHSPHIGLLPPLEIALIQIALIQIEEQYGGRGLSIVGYFHANERFDDDTELSNVAKNIADHIHRYFPHPALLLLDNKKLQALSKAKDRTPVMQLYTRGDSSKSWKLRCADGSNRLSLKDPSANLLLLDYISSRKWEQIVDFDDHLDDISKDWMNAELFK